MTSGEKRLARVLESHLEADYLLWYDVPIGRKRRQPDFIILHPQRGIIVLEVKDWSLSMIQQVDRKSVLILTEAGEKSVQNPLEQARDCVLGITRLLERDPLLTQSVGRHRGKLAFPYSYGVVFANITRKQLEAAAGLREVFEPNLVLCKDEIYETVDSGEFQQRLWNLCTYEYGEPLTAAQIDRIRWHIFPEVRIDHTQLSLFEEASEAEVAEAIPDLLRVMDIQQEQLARSLGEGHRVVHGVAGSGKTLILVYRCLHLVEQLTKPILVLCFNVSLAAKLRQMLHEKGIGERITVRHFHSWCADLLWQARIPKPNSNQFQGEAYIEELVQRVIRSVDAGLIPAGRYGAVMIDEGHDFQPEWLKLAAQMVDPETNSLLVLYDDAQTIYEKRRQQKFSFKSVGIQAQGRTTVFKLNYRNTQEVLAVAYVFAKDMLIPTEEQEEDTPVLVQPQSAGRHGPKPELIRLPSFKQEADYLIERVRQFQERGTAWNEMAIIYRSRFMGEQIYKRLQTAQLPVEWVNQNDASRNFRAADPSIKLITMHSSKGLEFPVVLIPGIGFMPMQSKPPEEEARLLYIGMTRAINQLVMTCDRSSSFVKRLEQALGKGA
jgi:hypothetical protein